MTTNSWTARLRRGLFWLLGHTINPVALRLARSGRGFALVRHRGRKTGRSYETPLILAAVDGGFVAELTYGTDVAWYRNVVAAGGCEVRYRGVDYAIAGVEPYPTDPGRKAFGVPASWLLWLLRRREYRLLHIADA